MDSPDIGMFESSYPKIEPRYSSPSDSGVGGDE